MVANRIKSQHIEKRDSGAFLHTYILPVEKGSVTTSPNDIKNRKRITLPTAIYDFNKDAGIDYVAYYRADKEAKNCPPDFGRLLFRRTSPKEAKALYMSAYEKPNQSRPYFYRTGDYVYFLGVECVDIPEIEIGLYSTFDPVTSIDIDQTFDFPEELLLILKRQVLDLGRFALLMPQETVNDGRSTIASAQVPENKLVSVNDPISNPQN